MIADWLGQWPALLTALVVVFAPGLLIGAGLRLRGLALWALAPVGSTAVLAGLAVLYGAVHIPWSPLWVGVGCLVVIAIAWLAGLALGPRRQGAPHDRRGVWLLAAGLAIGVIFAVLRFTVYVGEPRAISQTNDAVFHLNAIRYIIETDSASSLHVSGVIGGRGFYPSAWHGLASLVVMISGSEIPVAANMLSLVIAAAIWPLGIAWFTRQATGGSAGATAAAAALSASLPAFPMLMFEWGVLYSYALSVALLPAAAGVVISAPRWISGEGPIAGGARSAVLAAVLAVAGVAALALSQPASILAWAIVAVSWFTWWFALHVRSTSGRRRSLLIGALVAVWLAFAAVWFVLTRSTTGSHWPPFRGKLVVALDVLLNGQVMLPFAVGVSILMVIGLVVAVRRPSLRWLASAWLVFAVLYMVCAAIGQPTIRRALLGAWYADPYRLAALAPLTVIPLAAIGLAAVATWATIAISRREGRAAETFGMSWALVAVAGLSAIWFAVAPMTQMPAVTEDRVDTESRYQMTGFLSPDERLLLEQLADEVPEGARVIGNPSTGMAFAYMLSGSDVFPRTWAHPRTPEWRIIQNGLRDAGTDPAVCEALEVYGSPEYVLDFGLGEDSPGRFELPGMTDFEGQPGFELVAEQGDASLWRMTACEP